MKHAQSNCPVDASTANQTIAKLRKLVVVMPAYNESDGLPEFLRDVDWHVSSLAESVTFVVVDDASSPSLEAAVRMAAQHSAGTVGRGLIRRSAPG